MKKYIVSDEYNFVYFVVPKVACSSIKTALLPLFDDIDTSPYETVLSDGAPGFRIHKLFDESGYQINEKQLLRDLNEEYQEYFKFAFVRNPWDRLVSCYFQKLWDVEKADLGNPGLKLPGREDSRLYKGMPFAEFVQAVSEIPDSKANPHFRSQHKTICGPERDKPLMADFVGRFENLRADFSVVAERIGAGQKLQLPHLLRSRSRKSRSYTELYDSRLRNLVHERYQEDIEIFKYSFGESHSPPPLWRDGRTRSQRPNKQDVESGSREQTSNLARQLQVARKRNRNLTQELQVVKKRNRDLTRQLQYIRSSKSWRLLAIINKLRGRLPRSLGRR